MLTADRVGGALVLLKAIDVAVRGPVELSSGVWLAVLTLWVAAGLVLLTSRGGFAGGRVAWGVVLLAGAGLAVDYPLELRRQHLVLLMGVALAAAVARHVDERLLLWRVQLTALYGVAALAKVNESFLGGDVLARGVVAAPLWSALLAPPPLPLLLGAGIVLIATEALLAVTPWVRRLRRPGTAVAAGFHLLALLLASTSPLVGLRLVVFGGTAVLLHAASAGLVAPGAAHPATADRRLPPPLTAAGRRRAPGAGPGPAPGLSPGPRRRRPTSRPRRAS